MWEYRAELDRVVDGDTIDFTVDLGFNMFAKIRVRLADVDTHETYGVDHDSEEYKRGKKEAEFVRLWLEDADEIVIQTEKTDKYGRWIAEVYRRRDNQFLNDQILYEFDGVDI